MGRGEFGDAGKGEVHLPIEHLAVGGTVGVGGDEEQFEVFRNTILNFLAERIGDGEKVGGDEGDLRMALSEEDRASGKRLAGKLTELAATGRVAAEGKGFGRREVGGSELNGEAAGEASK